MMGSRLRKSRRRGLGYNAYLDGFRVCCTLKRSTHVRTRSSAEVRGPGQGGHCTVWMSLAALVLEMTCYSGSPLQTKPGFCFSPNDRCGSTTTRLRRFRLPPSSRERTLVCFIVSTEGKYKRAGWYLRAHLLGRYPYGGAPASRRKGGRDRRNDKVRTRASFFLFAAKPGNGWKKMLRGHPRTLGAERLRIGAALE